MSLAPSHAYNHYSPSFTHKACLASVLHHHYVLRCAIDLQPRVDFTVAPHWTPSIRCLSLRKTHQIGLLSRRTYSGSRRSAQPLRLVQSPRWTASLATAYGSAEDFSLWQNLVNRILSRSTLTPSHPPTHLLARSASHQHGVRDCARGNKMAILGGIYD